MTEQKSNFLILLALMLLALLADSYIYGTGLARPPIRSDGMGYYLYLPAIFIEGDLTLSSTIAGRFRGELPVWAGILPTGTGSYLIKYGIGVALLQLPFFGLATLVAYGFDYPVNGYSAPFHWANAVSGIFYLLLGVCFCFKLGRRYFSRQSVLAALVVLVFGTNLFHYATFDASFSHIYSFAMISGLMLVIDSWYRSPSSYNSIMLGIFAGFILIIRQVNLFALLMIPLWGISSFNLLRTRLALLWKMRAKISLSALAAVMILSPQLLYWYLVTGKWLVYSYGGESFNFLNPRIAQVLMSEQKGLFLWFPSLLLALFLFCLKPTFIKSNRVALVLVLTIQLYVLSCWYLWTLGGGFGYRGLVEFYPLLVPLIAGVFEIVKNVKVRACFYSALVFALFYTNVLMLLYWHYAPRMPEAKLGIVNLFGKVF